MNGTDAPAPGRGYEQRDAQSRWLLIGGAGLFALAVVAFALIAWLSDSFQERDLRAGGPPHPMAAFRAGPPGAQLQATPSVDYRAFRARQDELLTGYGWVDPGEGLVRIPIERAKELLLQRGLPAREDLPEDGG